MISARTASMTVLAAVLAVALVACGNDDNEVGTANAGEWPAFFALSELVQSSDAIVVARLLEERTELIEAPQEQDASARDTVTEILRTFEVEEAIAGVLQPGDVLTNFSTANLAHDPGDGGAPREVAFQVLRLEQGKTYLLFLTMVVMPDFYPEEWGVVGWAAPGEPHTARIEEDGRLRWLTTGRYDDARKERNIDAGASGAGPEFDTTLESIRGLAAAQGGDGAGS